MRRSELLAGPVELPDLGERDFGTTVSARTRDTDVQSYVFKLPEPREEEECFPETHWNAIIAHCLDATIGVESLHTGRAGAKYDSATLAYGKSCGSAMLQYCQQPLGMSEECKSK